MVVFLRTMDLEDSNWSRSGGVPLPITSNDESYQGELANGFENSRGGGIRAFDGVNIQGTPNQPQSSSAAPGDDGKSLWAAWSDATATNGVKPLDFGFLLDDQRPVDKNMSDDSDCSPVISQVGSQAKRLRGNFESPDKAILAGFLSNSPTPTHCCVPPKHPRRPQKVLFGKVPGEDRGTRAMDPPVRRTDVYAWMKGNCEASPEVLDLMKEENRYTDVCQEHLKPLRETLYSEMLAHQREDDESLIISHPGGYGYFTKYVKGKSYGAEFRRRAIPGGGWGNEELVIDQNVIAVDASTGSQRPYSSVSGPHPNPTHTLFAYATDFAGNDSYTIHLRPFGDAQNAYSEIALEQTDGSVQWSSSGDRFYYVTLDDAYRQCRLKCHILGQDPKGSSDATLLEETDKKYWIQLSQTGCYRFLIVTCASAETMENYLLDLENPASGLGMVFERRFGHQYGVDHRSGWLYILTNKDGKKNSKLCRAPLSGMPIAAELWEDTWVPPDQTKLDSHCCFKSFMALEGRENGECRIFVCGYGEAGGIPLHSIAFPDAAAHLGHVLTPRGAQAAKAAFCVGLCGNNIFDTEVLRYTYSSFTVPGLTYAYRVETKEHCLLRSDVVPNFDPSIYRAERIRTPANQIPISMVYRKDIHPNGLVGGPFPLLLTGYGAYGCCQDPDFDGNRLSLLDRGVVYAVVHVRGGGEFGHDWHEKGKNLKVKNRFADFLEAAETLVNLRVTSPDCLAAWGTSSGGLLVTASVNLRPDLFRAVLLEVPFVDALNTMGDPTIPLTVGEWEEIGNPNERDYFYYMLEYSPYDNIRIEEYPAALVTASVNDSMVGFWEPLKYVAKLRDLKLDTRPVLLQTNFHAGHGAASDRYQSTSEAAFHFAFLLDQIGLAGSRLLGSWAK